MLFLLKCFYDTYNLSKFAITNFDKNIIMYCLPNNNVKYQIKYCILFHICIKNFKLVFPKQYQVEKLVSRAIILVLVHIEYSKSVQCSVV